jgi:aldehyde:ferredoxin oxidoreductase
MQVKGVELGMHEPRFKQGLGVGYAVNAIGGDHMSTAHDPMYSQEGPPMDKARSLGVTDPLRVDDLSPAKVSAVRLHHLWRTFGDSGVICSFVPWTFNQQVEAMQHLTGWDYTTAEALRLGERVVTMHRAYNLREGLSVVDDTLPKRFFEPTPRGGLKDTPIDPAAFEQAVETFYELMGWDTETGTPITRKLADLGIEWVDDELASVKATVA